MPDNNLALSFLFILFVCHVVNSGFYTKTDKITVLDGANFSTTIFGKNHSWLIEFYNSWCGHCREFAPTFKMIASNVQNWHHTLKVAAIDCAEENNYVTCRDIGLKGTPELRLMGANSKKNYVGEIIDTDGGSAQDIELLLVKHLEVLQKKGNGSTSWSNLQSYTYPLKRIRTFAPKNTKNAILITENVNSHIGKAVILDMSFIPDIYIRRKVSSKINDEVIIDIVPTNGKVISLHSTSDSRDNITNAIAEQLNLNDDYLQKLNEVHIDIQSESTEDLVSAADGEPSESADDDSGTDSEFLPDFSPTEKEVVYMVDIENALSYAITHEFSLFKVISGDALLSMKNFLKIIIKYLPMREPVKKFVEKLHDFVNLKSTVLSVDLTSAIHNFNEGDSFMPTRKPWVGCAGSEPTYRGYPCGLWTMFHAITVNAVVKDYDNLEKDPGQILRVIHGYIKYFFGCSYCSRHFQDMYAKDAEIFSSTPDDIIIWLWKSHNKVNKRLSGDVSEDPKHKKRPYPPASLCRSCWRNDFKDLDEDKVVHYMKTLYNPNTFSYDGVQEFHTVKANSKLPEMEIGNDTKVYWRVSYADMNLCVLLYVASTCVLIMCYLLFVCRKRILRRSTDLKL